MYWSNGSNCQEFLGYFENLFVDSFCVTCFNDILGTFGLTQMVTETTRLPKMNSTLLNLICYNPDILKGVG